MILENRLTRRHCQRLYPSRPLLAHRSRRLQARQSFDVRILSLVEVIPMSEESPVSVGEVHVAGLKTVKILSQVMAKETEGAF